jgi:hypothetical protein
MERARGSAMTNSLSMYSITENIYYSQLSSVAILLQPEHVFTSYSTRKDVVLCPNMLSPCGLPPTCLLVTVNEARSYIASTVHDNMRFCRSPYAPVERARIILAIRSVRQPSIVNTSERALEHDTAMFMFCFYCNYEAK